MDRNDQPGEKGASGPQVNAETGSDRVGAPDHAAAQPQEGSAKVHGDKLEDLVREKGEGRREK